MANTIESPELILRRAAQLARRALKESSSDGSENFDYQAANSLLEELSTLIIALPEQIQAAIARGDKFPDDEVVLVRILSCQAEIYALQPELDKRAILAVLVERGAKIGDPTALDKLIQRVYGSSQS